MTPEQVLDLVIGKMEKERHALENNGVLHRCTYSDAIIDLGLIVKEIKEQLYPINRNNQ